MAWDGEAGGGHIVKVSLADAGFSDKVFAYRIYVVTVVDIRKIIYLFNQGSAKLIHYGGSFVFGTPCDVLNETASEKQIVFAVFFPPVHSVTSLLDTNLSSVFIRTV